MFVDGFVRGGLGMLEIVALYGVFLKYEEERGIYKCL